MIRTDKDYKEAVVRFRQDLCTIEAQREEFMAMGLSKEESDRAMEPILSFHAQLSEEITWYENVARGNFSPTERLTDIGRLLIAARISKGLTQRELAGKLGVSESAVSRDERNEYHGITIDRAQRVLQAMGFDATATLKNVSLSECRDPLLDIAIGASRN